MLDTSLKAQDDRNPVPSFLNTINERIKMRQSLNAEKERQDYYNQLKSGLYGKEGVTQQPIQQGEGIGFNENGQYKIPAQQTFNPYGVDLSGLGGNEGNTISVSAQNGIQNFQAPKQNAWTNVFGTKSFGEPPTDNPQAQAVEGQVISPNYMSLMSNGQMTPQQQQAFDEKMNLRRWIEWDAQNNGVTNPLVALQRYQMFMEPMRQQAELDELRNAYYTFNDPEASDIDKRNAATLIEYAKKNPYMTEDHDMNTERFNWAKQNFENQQEAFAHQKSMWPLDFESKRLGLENTRSIINARDAKDRQTVRVGDILRGFTGQFYPINRPGNYEDSDLSKTRKELVDAADILNTYARNKFGKDLSVTGGWRNPDHNAGVNGSPTSHHLTGHAMDIDASKLTEAELADVQNFARAIGLNADGDDMYHDRGSGYHMHITLPEGYYLKSVDLGNGKFLTPEMMRNKGQANSGVDINGYEGAIDNFRNKPNVDTAQAVALQLVPRYKELVSKHGYYEGRKKFKDEIAKDPNIGGVVNGDNQLIEDIIKETTNVALNGVPQPDKAPQVNANVTGNGNQGGATGDFTVLSPEEQRRRSLSGINGANLEDYSIPMYNVNGVPVPDINELNKRQGNKNYYESLARYFGSGT